MLSVVSGGSEFSQQTTLSSCKNLSVGASYHFEFLNADIHKYPATSIPAVPKAESASKQKQNAEIMVKETEDEHLLHFTKKLNRCKFCKTHLATNGSAY